MFYWSLGAGKNDDTAADIRQRGQETFLIMTTSEGIRISICVVLCCVWKHTETHSCNLRNTPMIH